MSTGLDIAHESARLHVTGEAVYLDDIATPSRCLHLAFGLAEATCGEITGLDVSPIKEMDGVAAVLTADDLPPSADTSPSAHDEPLLASGEVQFFGQPVFIAAAESHRLARLAARSVRIEIAEGRAVLSIDEAIATQSELEPPLFYRKGDPESAIARAANRLSGSVTMGGQEHFYLEGQAAMAVPREDGAMLVYSSSQHPSEIQEKVAEALGVELSRVRVEVRRMGGAFGGKESQCNAPAMACALAAAATGRPCRMRYDRDDDMVITGKRHDFRIDYEVGFDDNGRIEGISFAQHARCGWSRDLSLAVADRAMLHADNAYNLDNVAITSHRWRTNTVSATAFRGFGGPQGMVGIEHAIDSIARTLGRDPLDVRMINYYRSQQPPAAAASSGLTPTESKPRQLASSASSDTVQTTPYHMEVTDSVIREITDDLIERSEYRERREAVARFNAKGGVLRRGIAITPVKFGISFTMTHYNQAGALAHVYRDGSVHINHGGTEMGQGLMTKVMQVAASAFGLPPGQVRVSATDTDKVPNTSATAASSGSDLNGMAAHAACVEIRDRMAAHLSEQWQKKPDQVRFEAGQVRIGDDSIPFSEAAQLCYKGRISMSATGFYSTPDIQWERRSGRGRPFYYFAYGAAVTEAVIDTLSGESRILRTDIVHDVGQSLNPAIDIGQIEGGFVQGAGWLTTEELVWDERGQLRTHAPSTYKIPACADRPKIFNVTLFKNENRQNTIHRSKAVGEPPLMLGISAFMAIADAVASCGDGFCGLDAPATPERVLRAVMGLQGQDW